MTGEESAAKSAVLASAAPGDGTLLASVQSRLARLRPAEAKVANVLLAEPDDFYQWSVTEVAKRARVSEATVIRFAKLFGFQGFQMLKIALAQERATADYGVLEVQPEDDWSSATVKLEQYYLNMVKKTLAVIRSQGFREVVEAIRNAPRVVALGVGTSGLAAQVLQYKLNRIGLRTAYFVDGHFQTLAAADMDARELAIAFSVSGGTRETADGLALAKEAGATTVAVTHFARSPLTGAADYILLSQGFDSPVVSGSILAHVSQLILVDAVYLGLALGDYEAVTRRMERSAEQIARLKKY